MAITCAAQATTLNETTKNPLKTALSQMNTQHQQVARKMLGIYKVQSKQGPSAFLSYALSTAARNKTLTAQEIKALNELASAKDFSSAKSKAKQLSATYTSQAMQSILSTVITAINQTENAPEGNALSDGDAIQIILGFASLGAAIGAEAGGIGAGPGAIVGALVGAAVVVTADGDDSGVPGGDDGGNGSNDGGGSDNSGDNGGDNGGDKGGSNGGDNGGGGDTGGGGN
jgi:hypothetical protein